MFAHPLVSAGAGVRPYRGPTMRAVAANDTRATGDWVFGMRSGTSTGVGIDLGNLGHGVNCC